MQSNELKRVKALAKRRAQQGSDAWPILDRNALNPGELQRLMDGHGGKHKLITSRNGYALKYIPSDEERAVWALS